MQTQLSNNEIGASPSRYNYEGVHAQRVSESEIPLLEPDEDFKRAISVEEFKEGILKRVRDYFNKKEKA